MSFISALHSALASEENHIFKGFTHLVDKMQTFQVNENLTQVFKSTVLILCLCVCALSLKVNNTFFKNNINFPSEVKVGC